jgi:hypothetical protein
MAPPALNGQAIGEAAVVYKPRAVSDVSVSVQC